MSGYLIEQIAEMRAEIAELKNRRVTRRAAQVTAIDTVGSTFEAVLPDGQTLGGLASPAEFLPIPGDWVTLTLQGGTPRYEPAAVTGLRSFATDPDGATVVTSKFGSDTDADRLVITDPVTGANLAVVNEQGYGTFTGATINGPLIVRGNSLEYLLDQLPRGEIVRAGVEASLPATSSALGAYDVEFTAHPGRSYRISTTPLNLNPSTTATYVYATLTVRPSAEGPPSLANGKPIVAARGSANIAGGVVPMTLSKNVGFNELFANNTPPNGQVATKVRVLLVYGVVSGGGTVGVFSSESYPAHTVVEDAGTSKPFTGVLNDGGGTTVTPVTETTADFGTAWARSYNGSDSGERSTTELVQGYTSYYPSAGSAISLLGFSDLTGVLSGASINWAALYLEATHWHNDYGGEIILGAHDWLNDTGTVKPGSGLYADQLREPFAGKSGGIWIYLPSSWFAGIKSGATRGFLLGNGTTTSTAHYARFVRAGTLRINYTK